MPPTQVLELAERFFRATFAGDAAAARKFYAPDAVIWHNTDRVEIGVEENMRIIEWFARILPDQKCKVIRREVLSDGFLQQDVLEATLPDGSRFTQTSCVIVRMRDGLIVRLDEYVDSAEIEPLRRFGLQTPRPGADTRGFVAGGVVPGTQHTAGPTARLAELGIVLPAPRASVANYVPAVRAGRLLFVSGQGPVSADGTRHTGKVGAEVSLEQAYEHARITGLNLLAAVQQALGTLEQVGRIVKVLGMVNAAPSFTQHPKVIDGCSDLLVDVFGAEVGRHARSAVGVGSLPGHITVEIELVVHVRD